VRDCENTFTSWSGRKFSQWLGCIRGLGEDEDAVECGWVTSKGPDVYGITHSEKVLCYITEHILYKVQDDLVPLHAKLVGTVQRPKPGPCLQHVNVKQAELLIKEVQTDMTAAVLSVVDDIEKRFPDSELLLAFRIVCPNFWNSEEEEEELEEQFSDSLGLLCDHFGVAHEICSGLLPAIVNKAELYDQASTYKVLARGAARKAREECGGGASVAASNGEMLVMWRKLSSAGLNSENQVGEFMKLARVLMTVVGTSVSDERAFSAMTFVKNSLRSSLEEHLEACVRVKEQTLFDLTTFPHTEVLETWRQASVRGRYLS
jgi:hypothetical protein